MNAIWIFTLATIVNVTLSTIRAICTIKSGKLMSAITNAVCYGFYPLIVMLTAQGTVEIIVNMAITALANFVCVYIIKLVEEKARKDKLWKVEATIPYNLTTELHKQLNEAHIAHNYIEGVGAYTIFNIYCPSQAVSINVRSALEHCGAKYFVSESKTL